MKQYVVGIDNGGTVTKAVVFDLDGVEVGSAFGSVAILTPKEGYTERDMNELWLLNARLIKEAIEVAGIKPSQILALASTGHGKGLYLWGEDNKPAYNGIVSTDSRAWQIEEAYYASGTHEKVYDKIVQSILACQPVCLLKWLKENDPQVIDATKYIFSVKDYIRFRLTDEAYLEITDFSGTGLMNLNEVDKDRDLLQDYGLDEVYNKLPPLKYAHDLCGTITKEASELTGLLQGTPVAGGMFDIDACAIAMNVVEESHLCVIAGTWSINEYVSKVPITDGSIMMNSLFCLPDYFLVEECSPTSASNSTWFIDRFLSEEKKEADKNGTSIYQITDEMIQGFDPESSKLVFLPFLYGSNVSSIAKASFVGLSSYHTKAHILGAVYEGIVFSHKTHIDKLLKNNKKAKVIRLAGGAAKSRVWVQMFADILQMPIEVVNVEELGALGCAMSATIAAGVYKDYQEAASHMVKVQYRLEPNRDKKYVYDEKYKRYSKVVDALDGIWEMFI